MHERRSEVRKPVTIPCWIDDDTLVMRGTVVDISPRGARVQVAAADRLPAEIDVWFTADRQVGRRYRIAWASAGQAGLQLLRSAGGDATEPGERSVVEL